MILSLTLLALIVLVSLWLVLEPLRASAPTDPDAAERDRLTAERDRLYGELAALEDERRRPDLERRAALILRALDALPPAPRRGRTRTLALAGIVAAGLLTVAGALTFVPRWQLASLNPDEAQNVRNVLALPDLRRRAEQTRDKAAYLAWGKAAFDSGQYDQAVTAYGNALKLDPRQPEALRRLGILLLTRPEQTGQTPKPEDAAQAFLLIRTAAQLAPNDPESQLLLGFALARFGQDTDALTALERYRTLDPSGRDADELITAIRARQNETDPGLRVYAASCASCHGPTGGGGLGPSLRVSTLTRAALRDIILHGQGAMPAFPKLKPAELKALLDVLERWQKEGP
ncbi:Cytochrome oxidase family protein containing TPR repeats [Deinococcus geothermalis DSM 11300]|uniref:Cytochrome oxidase family protein containing TPR repeats n=1 Tax=Deinococcus geothermalis (strain DSM 11300 / CIP 105573 / AG-3a) TaxID=319795 RepID=Q1IYY8_DEIGD|nr:c-type cytochrome [Deinococcus geothermalis]ABF45546.1 Cytochrome oxidase family protein containing TPR repeats [Deinococcus geothermalis DSM 11300]